MGRKSKQLIESERFFGELKRLRALPENSVDNIEAKAEASVKRLLNYFDNFGIGLNSAPTVRYTGEFLALYTQDLADLSIIACAGIQSLDHSFALFEWVGRDALRIAIEENYGLKLSDKELKEMTDKEPNAEYFKRKEVLTKLIETADIILFKPLLYDLKDIDELIAHEIWHLIEKQHNIFDNGVPINEGTATFTQFKFAGKPFRWSKNKKIMSKTTYQNTAYLVNQEVKKEENPHTALLNQWVRQKIARSFEQKIKPIYFRNLVEQYKDELNVMEFYENSKCLSRLGTRSKK